MGRFASPFQHEAGAHIPGLVHGTLALAGGRLHYVEAGSGTVLLLIHGGHGSWTHWIANLEPLARMHRVIALDMPGFGGSYRPHPDYTIEQYVDTVIEVMNSLHIATAAIAGFSFGSVVAAAAARMSRRLTHLVMINAPGIGPASPEAATLMKALTELSLRQGLRAGATASLKRIQLYDHARIDDGLVDRMMANVRLTKFVSRDLSAAARTEAWLAQIRQPTLVFIGREDIHRRFGLADGLKAIAHHAPHAQVHLVEHAAHWLQFDRAALFNALVADFLREPNAGSPQPSAGTSGPISDDSGEHRPIGSRLTS